MDLVVTKCVIKSLLLFPLVLNLPRGKNLSRNNLAAHIVTYMWGLSSLEIIRHQSIKEVYSLYVPFRTIYDSFSKVYSHCRHLSFKGSVFDFEIFSCLNLYYEGCWNHQKQEDPYTNSSNHFVLGDVYWCQDSAASNYCPWSFGFQKLVHSSAWASLSKIVLYISSILLVRRETE